MSETPEEETPVEVPAETLYVNAEYVETCQCDISTRQNGFCPHGNNV